MSGLAQNNNEIEMKLTTLNKEYLDNIFDLDIIKNAIVQGSEKTKLLESHYYDTPKRGFAKAGAVFRIRKEPEAFIATVKMETNANAGFSDRFEYNVTLQDLVPEFSGFDGIKDRVDLGTIARKENGVEELFAVIVNRRQCNLVITTETIAELAVDEGKVTVSDKSEPIAELELELVEGNVKDLVEFVARLARSTPLFAEVKSKYVKGALLAGEKVKLEKVKPLVSFNKGKPLKVSVSEAIIAQVSYLLVKTKELNNVFLDNSTLKNDSILHEIKKLQDMVTVLNPFIDDEDFTQKKDKISFYYDIFSNYFFFTNIMLPQIRYAHENINFKDETLETITKEKIMELHDKIKEIIMQGDFSAFLFEIWAWLLKEPWSNNLEMPFSTYLLNETFEFLDKFDTEYAENKEKTLVDAYEKIVFITALNTFCQKFLPKKLVKIDKKLRKLIKMLDAKMLFEQAEGSIFSMFGASAGRLVYRDAGVVLGLFMQTWQVDDKEIEKNVKDLLRLFKKYKKS